MEQWKKIAGTDYEVSSEGRVKRGDKIIKSSVNSRGYQLITIAGKTRRLHRVVAEAFLDNPEQKEFVNHIDGNTQNNRLENLEWITNSDNVRHARSILKKSTKAKSVIKITEDLEPVAHYNSMAEAERINGMPKDKLRDIIRTHRKINGFYFVFAKEEAA